MNLNLSYDGNVWDFKEDIIEKLSTGELYPVDVETTLDVGNHCTVTITCHMVKNMFTNKDKITNKDSKYYKYYQEEIEELEQENKDLKEENEELRNELNSLLEEVNCSD
jgi:FtsZ-binding cell division protein ZapB